MTIKDCFRCISDSLPLTNSKCHTSIITASMIITTPTSIYSLPSSSVSRTLESCRVIVFIFLLAYFAGRSCRVFNRFPLIREKRRQYPHLLESKHKHSYNSLGSSSRTHMENSSNLDHWGEEQGVGEQRWHALREQWLTADTQNNIKEDSTNGSSPSGELKKHHDYVDVDTVVEYLIHPKRPPFPKPVPLPEIVDILIELWEAEYTTL
mmetsp:Transcript_4756/g.17835  ORF Transcript_4756/g.17835 Transcript_4756/m.17835 type:complete len:208 (-) Transcript_4756:2560-3183(-)